MPDLVNMKRADEEMESESNTALAGSEPAYPWGLRLRLRDEELDKLDIETMPGVGQTMMMVARVEVVEVEQYKSSAEDGDTKALGLQIVDMQVGPDKPKRRRADILYGGDGGDA